MTWSDLIHLGPKFAPNADIYLRVQTEDRLVPVNYRLGSVTKEGQIVFLEAAEMEDMRETNP